MLRINSDEYKVFNDYQQSFTERPVRGLPGRIVLTNNAAVLSGIEESFC